MTAYVYYLTDEDDNNIFYVGSTMDYEKGYCHIVQDLGTLQGYT